MSTAGNISAGSREAGVVVPFLVAGIRYLTREKLEKKVLSWLGKPLE